MGKTELEKIVDLWTTMFADDSAEMVACAVKAHIATDKNGYPPVIGVIKDKLRQITQPPVMTEQEAWGLVLKAMDCSEFDIRKKFNELPPVVRSIVGTPRQLWDWGMMDADTVQSVVASNFMRSYRSRAQQQQDFDALPSDVQQVAIGLGSMFSLNHAIGLEDRND